MSETDTELRFFVHPSVKNAIRERMREIRTEMRAGCNDHIAELADLYILDAVTEGQETVAP